MNEWNSNCNVSWYVVVGRCCEYAKSSFIYIQINDNFHLRHNDKRLEEIFRGHLFGQIPGIF